MHPAGRDERTGRGRGALIAVAGALLALALSGCTFMQFNIANGNHDPTEPQNFGQDAVIRMVQRGDGPTVMTLQEVCEGRFHQIAREIAPYGYHGDFDNLESAACGAQGPGYGNAIFHQGGHTSWNGQPDGRYLLHFRRNREPSHRHAMGRGINIGGVRAVVWTTHLEANSDEVAAAQSAELLATVRVIEAASGLPQIVGGDFNLTPGQPSMGAWRNHFHEADGALRPTTDGGDKLDYLLSSIPWKSVGVFVTNTSDHHRLIGGF